MDVELDTPVHPPSTITPIADVRASVLRSSADITDIDGSSETLLVEIEDAEGRVGIGEADTASEAGRVLMLMPDANRWNAGLRSVLLGHDPVQVGALWDRLADATRFQGPSGIARHVLAAVDIALHDLAGKQLSRPSFHLLGGARRDRIRPYATIYAGAARERTLGELMDVTCALIERAVGLGFRAVKMEVLFDDLADDRRLVECIREGRRIAGDDVELLVDFGYRWHHWRDALWVLRQLDDARIWLAEATLQHDDIVGHARLASAVETRVGGAELAATREECRIWIEHGRVDVLQPDVARAGGLTELRRIADMAADHGVEVVPHCWKTGINAAAARHLQAATRNVPLIEMLPIELFDSPLRRELVEPEPRVVGGFLPLPTAPGLGVHLNPHAVERYQIEVPG